MTANVRCSGREEITYPFPGVRKTGYTRPCGWTGERYAMGVLTEQEATLPAWSANWRAAVALADAKARTAKPCPKCGGRVELIPAENQP